MDQIADNTLWITHLAAGEFASLSRGAQTPDSLENIYGIDGSYCFSNVISTAGALVFITVV